MRVYLGIIYRFYRCIYTNSSVGGDTRTKPGTRIDGGFAVFGLCVDTVSGLSGWGLARLA